MVVEIGLRYASRSPIFCFIMLKYRQNYKILIYEKS